MAAEKMISAFINVTLAFTIALLLLTSAPWVAALPAPALYFAAIAAFWLLLLLRLLLSQWQKNRPVAYKSYLGPDNKVKKKLIAPGAQDLAEAAAGLLKLPYVAGLLALALLFLLNHLLLFYPYFVSRYIDYLFDPQAGSFAFQEQILPAACLAAVLALALIVLAQTRALKQNNQIFNNQNLIINAHSQVSLGGLRIDLDSDDQMFLALSKLEYVLRAKSIAALQQPQGQALLKMGLSLNLGNTIPLTDFYVKRLSLHVGDLVIECENDNQKFFPMFALNNDFALEFYIFFKKASALQLAEKLFAAAGLRLYFCFLLKNSVGVITEYYGTALYQRDIFPGNSLHYLLQESKGNQYFYL